MGPANRAGVAGPKRRLALKQAEEAKIPLELKSPRGRVRAELSVETVWIGATVYPECPVWRAWCDGRPVVDTSLLGLAAEAGPLAYGMRLVTFSRHRPQTRIGPGRSLVARFAARDGRELEATLRVTELSAFCAVRERAGKKTRRLAGTLAPLCQAETGGTSVPASRDEDEGQDLSITRFPEGSVLLGRAGAPNAQRSTLNAQCSMVKEGEEPQVRFAPSGKVVAWWRHGLEQHAVFFDRPGDLAVRRFGALPQIAALPVADGRQGCEHLFLTVPFTQAALPEPSFGAAVTPAYRAAFARLLGREGAGDDFWMIRGEPGEFAVGARREGGVWRVAGVTALARTLTVRFEDLWLRMPPELRAGRYAVELLRDPVKGEPGDRVEEAFAGQAPDVRVALDLAADGGFLLTFRPQGDGAE